MDIFNYFLSNIVWFGFVLKNLQMSAQHHRCDKSLCKPTFEWTLIFFYKWIVHKSLGSDHWLLYTSVVGQGGLHIDTRQFGYFVHFHWRHHHILPGFEECHDSLHKHNRSYGMLRSVDRQLLVNPRNDNTRTDLQPVSHRSPSLSGLLSPCTQTCTENTRPVSKMWDMRSTQMVIQNAFEKLRIGISFVSIF